MRKKEPQTNHILQFQGHKQWYHQLNPESIEQLTKHIKSVAYEIKIQGELV